jgi:hypothetical protein
MATVEAPRLEKPESTEREDRPCAAETVDCTCPDFCERDHDNE